MKHKNYASGLVILLFFAISYNTYVVIDHLRSTMGEWDAIGIPLITLYFMGHLTYYCIKLAQEDKK